MNKYEKIYEKIKKFKIIYVVRHIGPDPDAYSSQIALRDSIRLSFPTKRVLALGASLSKYKFIGRLDKSENFDYDNTLIIALDVPDKKRVDLEMFNKFKNVIKIDHHPFIEKFSSLEIVDDSYSSNAQIIYELISRTPLKINKDIAKNLVTGIISDTNRFMFDFKGYITLDCVTNLTKKFKLNLNDIYDNLYERPLSEIRLMGFIASNIKVTKNGFAYILLEEDIINSFGADLSSSSNMINSFNNIKEVNVWMFIIKDEKNEGYRLNIRSKGPSINDIATRYNGGGHKKAAGVKNISKEDVDKIINEFDELCRNYNNAL